MATSATETAISRNRSRILGQLWRPRGQKAIQEAQRNPPPTSAKRYAQCGFGDTCAQNHANHWIFCTSRRNAKIGHQTGRANRYAQCGFVDMRGLKRLIWQQVRCMFCNFAKAASNCDNIKSITIVGNMCINIQHKNNVCFRCSRVLMNFENVARTQARSNILKQRTCAKSKIFKIYWKYDTLWAMQNRHVRKTMEFIAREQLCKIKEIGFK